MTEITDLRQDSTTTVLEFLRALEIGAVDEALALVTEDVVWRNTSLPTIRGRRRLRAMLAPLSKPPLSFAVELHHVAGNNEGVVLTDRTDILGIGPVRTAFWVCGTFELRDGKIALWHDHFSWENLMRGVAVGVARAILPGR